MHDLFIQPFITEKTLILATHGWYTFRLPKRNAKAIIAEAIENLYKVNVINVRTISVHGKMKRVGKGMKRVRKPDWMKAMVLLKKGQKIDVFEVTQPEEKKK